MPRPTILNEELIKKLSDEIADGLPIKYACDLFAISTNNFQNWVKQGDIDNEAEVESIFRTFFVSIKRAKAQWIKKAKDKIINGVGNEWQGTAWWLERTDYEQFSRKDGGDNNNTERIIVNTVMKKNKK